MGVIIETIVSVIKQVDEEAEAVIYLHGGGIK